VAANKATDYSLNMRILSKAIYITAQNYGYSKYELAKMGVTATNIVFSHVSSINMAYSSILTLSLNANIGTIIALDNSEDNKLVQNHSGDLIN
jgi:hypothetical protein